MRPAERSGEEVEREDLDDVEGDGVVDDHALVFSRRGHETAVRRGREGHDAALVREELLHELDALGRMVETGETMGNFFQILTLPLRLAV